MRISFLFILLSLQLFGAAPKYPTLEIGAQAPDFTLKNIDDKMYSLSDYKGKVLVIIFTCNHCPTSQAYEERIIKLVDDYKDEGVDVVVISSADPKAVRIDELGYSILDDSFEAMKIRAKERNYNHPYLYDGDDQKTSMAYGPIATPHVFIFDSERKLRFEGRIDNDERQKGENVTHDTRNAIDEILAGKKVTVETTRVRGCSTKWSYKREQVKKFNEEWLSREVTLEEIDEAGIKELVANKTEKLRLINVWATWCGPCVSEIPDLVEVNRQFDMRQFEVVMLSADFLNQKKRALQLLKSENAAMPKRVEKSVKKEGRTTNNYIANVPDRDKMIDAVDSQWQGPLPHTLLIAPGGEVIWRHTGEIDFLELRKEILKYRGNVFK